MKRKRKRQKEEEERREVLVKTKERERKKRKKEKKGGEEEVWGQIEGKGDEKEEEKTEGRKGKEGKFWLRRRKEKKRKKEYKGQKEEVLVWMNVDECCGDCSGLSGDSQCGLKWSGGVWCLVPPQKGRRGSDKGENNDSVSLF